LDNAIIGRPFGERWHSRFDFLYAAKNMGVQATSCTVVEDSVLGVRAGVAAGMRVLGYTEQTEASTLEACGARVFQPYQLPSLLSQY
jgi:beta-phosphoglucomutase-like phosphatase (HAD superfamily)